MLELIKKKRTPLMTTSTNANPAELEKFAANPHRWWDAQGELATLHHINPLRLNWITAQAGGSLKGKRILDIGCGGGILAESMAKQGAVVTGLDLAAPALEIARLHALESGLDSAQLNYVCDSAENYAAAQTEPFDIITCMEMLEHVPQPAAIIGAASRLLKPGGVLCLSTLNRSAWTFFGAIVAAEYLLRIVPKGTHTYAQCITPAELASMTRAAGLTINEVRGMGYNPLTKLPFWENTPRINYFMAAQKSAKFL